MKGLKLSPTNKQTLYVVQNLKEIVNTRESQISKQRRDRLDYIAEIFKYIEVPDEKKNPLFYNDMFDRLYDEPMSRLRLTLSVYRDSYHKR